MQMLKHSNHTEKLCCGFPRPPHSSLIDSQGRLTHSYGLLQLRDTKQRQQKEMCMRQSPEETRHKLSRALSNGITQNPLKFLQQLVVTPPVKCHLPEAHQRFSAQFLLKLVTQVLSVQRKSKSQTSRRKGGVPRKPYLYNKGTVSHSSHRVIDTFPKVQVPRHQPRANLACRTFLRIAISGLLC